MRYCTLFILISTLFIYLGIGGVIFHYLEHENEINTQNMYIDSIKTAVNNSCLTEAELSRIISLVQSASSQGVALDQLLSDDEGRHHHTVYWDVWSAFLFSTTVATTIGYGHVTPVTDGGKLFTIFFALFGIPLTVVCLAYIGEKLKYIFDKIFSNSRIVVRFTEDSHFCPLVKFAASVILSCTLFILIPAAIFTHTEKWDMITGIYYGFVTLSTIGFGDYVAGSREDSLHPRVPNIVIILWIFLGLSAVSMILGIVNDVFRSIGDQVVSIRENKSVAAEPDQTRGRDVCEDIQGVLEIEADGGAATDGQTSTVFSS